MVGHRGPAGGPGEVGKPRDKGEYRIDTLARLAGTTVRNVRAYQDRGLLPRPRRQGRVAYYSDVHLARLGLVARLLERGYTLANIAELLAAWQRGQDVGELLGLEAALAAPWSEERPVEISAEDLAALFGPAVPASDPDALARATDQAVAAGVLEPADHGFVVRRPGLLRIGVELVEVGIPLDAVLRLGGELFADVEVIARRFVELAVEHVFDPVGEPIPAGETARLADVVTKLRPLAQQSVELVLADAMERLVTTELQVRLSRMLGDGQSSEAS